MLFYLLLLLLHIASAASALTVPTPTASYIVRIREATISGFPPPTAAPTGNFVTTQYVTVAGVTDEHVTLAGQTIAIAIPTCIQTIAPDKNGYVPPGTCNALYNYYPSFAAAVVGSVMFGMLSFAHIFQAAKFKTKFCWVLIMGALWETSSFVTRSISTRHQQNSGLQLVSTIFVLLAPLWINAFAYLLLARMVHFYLPTHSILSIPAPVLSFLFVLLDIVSFIIQLIGGSYAGPTAPLEQQMKGIHIYMGGIGLQQFFIFVFLGLAVRFHLLMGRNNGMGRVRVGWGRLLWSLYASLGFITIRIFYRLIEFSSGTAASNPLPHHESYFYVLEAVPMFFAILCYNITHPGTVLVGPAAELPGLWGMVREKFCCGRRRGRGKVFGDDGEELVGRYEGLGGKDGSPPRYNAEFVEMDERPGSAREWTGPGVNR